MGKILIAITGQHGITNASLELARRLEADGHETLIAAPRPIGDRVTPAGVRFHELPAINEQPEPFLPDYQGPTRPLRRLLHRYLNRGKRRAAALAATDPRTFTALLDDFRPDLLLCDVELHEYIFVAYGRNQRFALLSQWYTLWDDPGTPYQLTDLLPGEIIYYDDTVTPEMIAENWADVRRKRNRAARRMALLSGGTDRRSTLLALADREGFPRKHIRKNFWPGPFTYEGIPVLAMVPRELEFAHDSPDFLHYVGPMVRADRPERAAQSHRGLSVSEIAYAAAKEGTRLVVCTVSTMPGQADDFLVRLIEAARATPAVRFIIGTGGVSDGLPKDIPRNVNLFDFAPQLKALAKADLSINHGGIHTVHECLHFGVPQLIYYRLQSDQPGCAARVHHHGVGIRAPRERDDAADIRLMIGYVLDSKDIPANIQRVQRHLRAYADDRVLETLVRQFLNAKTPLFE